MSYNLQVTKRPIQQNVHFYKKGRTLIISFLCENCENQEVIFYTDILIKKLVTTRQKNYIFEVKKDNAVIQMKIVENCQYFYVIHFLEVINSYSRCSSLTLQFFQPTAQCCEILACTDMLLTVVYKLKSKPHKETNHYVLSFCCKQGIIRHLSYVINSSKKVLLTSG